MATNKKSSDKPLTKSKTAGVPRKTAAEKDASPLPKAAAALARFKFSRLGADDKLAARLVNAGFQSLQQMAALDVKTLKDKLAAKLSPADEKHIATLQINARRLLTHAADQAVLKMQLQTPGGRWLIDPDKPKGPGSDLADRFKFPCHCGCCDSIFSLKAYIFDLLDLLAQYWRIDLKTVETLLLRGFDQVTAYDPRTSSVFFRDLDCEALNEPVPQAHIACKVLEIYVQKLGKSVAASWEILFVDGLLRLILPQQLAMAMIADEPSLAKRNTKFTIAKVEDKIAKIEAAIARGEAAPKLPEDFATAISQWKAELSTLVPDLAGIDRAAALLADNAQGNIGYEPDDKFAERREATVRQWLTGYRDALHTATAIDVDTLEASLFISLDSGACRTTTRLQELMTSLQQIVESIRSGEIARLKRPDLVASVVTLLQEAVTLPLAESAWVRLRDYETWLGYTYGWVYPENVLSPFDKDAVESEEFKAILDLKKIQDPMTRNVACELYLEGVAPVALFANLKALITDARASGARPDPNDQSEYGEESPVEMAHILLAGRDQATREIQKNNTLEYWKNVYADNFVRSNLRSELRKTSDVLFLGSDHDRDLWFPLIAAQLLNRNQQYVFAHEWFRMLYDPETQRTSTIFDKYKGEISSQITGTNWLDEPFDPVKIAFRRKDVWLRHTILAMVRNLIDWADDEFARGLPDTYQRAEELYELARRTLQAPPLQNNCDEVLKDLVVDIAASMSFSRGVVQSILQPLKTVQSANLLKNADKDIRKTLAGKGTVSKKRQRIERIISAILKVDSKQRPDANLGKEVMRLNTLTLASENFLFSKNIPTNKAKGLALSVSAPPRAIRTVPDFVNIIPPDGRPFDGPPLKQPPIKQPPSVPVLSPSARPFCIPPNPLLHSLQLHINTQLDKLRRCLDFMGEPQLPRVYDCDTYDVAIGTINRPTATLDQYNYCVDQPRYRYSYLIEKARQYVDVAERLGSLLLQALQNSDNEAFSQLKARHAIELAGATIDLRRLGRKEAEDGTEIAGLQQERAESQLIFWTDRVGDPNDLYDDLSSKEAKSLQLLNSGAELSRLGAIGTASFGIAAAALGAAATATGVGAPIGIPLIIAGTLMGASQGLSALGSANITESNALQTAAGFDQRGEDWLNQFELAGLDSQIADVQVTLADDRLAIAGQELQIALLQFSQAQEELRFLQTKFTNPALYDWMVRVLSRDYRALMQLASCVARMAQRALEFERQETVRIITGDYWNIAQGVLASTALTDSQRSMGLLGAERLLTDLTKLDAYKLATEKRRLQLSKTFSLARLMPTDMVDFRDTGSITFNTLLNWFDEGFQGHYLRLIKSVRVSILALVPPLDGIHAMLHNTGESTVVVLDNGEFTEKRAARNFGESIALDSAFNETGLFVMNYDDPMLLPFEGLGVETQWTLELPRGNNRFNFDTIADVFLTIEYTAEYSREYERQLRNERAGKDVFEDTAIPLRIMFPDLWYHMKNKRPDVDGNFTPFQFKFSASQNLFPQNLGALNVEHLTLLLSGDFSQAGDQQTIESGLTIKKKNTTLYGAGAQTFSPGLGDANSLLLSSRGTGAADAMPHPVISATAAEDWLIELAPPFYTAAVGEKPLIERISDVLLVITVKGKRMAFA